ncbi:MAG: peptidoglycan-binding protein [Acidimicrobiia bacterium]
MFHSVERKELRGAMSALRITTAALAALAFAFALAPSAAASLARGAMVDYDLAFPVDGEVHFEDSFGDPRTGHTHEGQDLFATKGTPVLAVSSGTVRLVNWSAAPGASKSRCCSIVLSHDDGWESRYLHLDNDRSGTDDGEGWGIADGVAPGVEVKAGRLLGWVGDSGNAESTPSHLHFELRDPHGTVVNPFAALRTALADADPLLGSTALVRRGASGQAVVRLQEILIELGYEPGSVDGRFGPATGAAVVSFQEDNGLDPDGLVGPASKDAMRDLLRPLPVLRRGDRGDEVELLQGMLAEAGFDPGPVDGIFGRLTFTAVTGYQESRSLMVDGIVGPQTWGALRMR